MINFDGNTDVGDLILVPETAKFMTKILNLSVTNFVSNIRHQYRCKNFRPFLTDPFLVVSGSLIFGHLNFLRFKIGACKSIQMRVNSKDNK